MDRPVAVGDAARGPVATEAARRADLVLFVAAEDLTDTALAALRELSDIGKPIIVALNKTDQKKSKFTMTVFADDREIEKKDRTAGEPIQFYVGGTRMAPYEIVVFKVGKDQLTGYLSTPKDAGSAAAAAPAATPAKQ